MRLEREDEPFRPVKIIFEIEEDLSLFMQMLWSIEIWPVATYSPPPQPELIKFAKNLREEITKRFGFS